MRITPTLAKPSTNRPLGLTGKGNAAALLIRVRDQWEQLSPSQQAECSVILGRLSEALRREHSVAARATAAVRVPLLGRLSA